MSDVVSDAPALEDCGFIKVPGGGAEPLWMTCDQCGKSDHFWIDGAVRCRCGARYSHALRPDGEQVPLESLTFVPFKQGPLQLADLELDPKRLALLATLVIGAIILAVFLLRG